MTYDLAKRLKEAGFPQKKHNGNCYDYGCFEVLGDACVPTSDELIKELGDKFGALYKNPLGGYECMKFSVKDPSFWEVVKNRSFNPYEVLVKGSTPLEALAELYIATNGK